MTLPQFSTRVIEPISIALVVIALQPYFQMNEAGAIVFTLLGLAGIVMAAYIRSQPGINFRQFNAWFFEPGAILTMIAGVVALCQPWSAFLHTYSVAIILFGIIAFNIAVHVPPPEPAKAEEEQHG